MFLNVCKFFGYLVLYALAKTAIGFSITDNFIQSIIFICGIVLISIEHIDNEAWWNSK